MKHSLFSRLVLLLLPVVLLFTACGSTEPTEPPPTGTSRTTLSAVGDIYLTKEMVSYSRGASGVYDFMPLFSQIVTQTAKSDLTIGNLEGTFANTAEGSYPDALAVALAQSGFDILQTANSYSVYQGLSGLTRTKDVIEEQGLHALGTSRSKEESTDQNVLIKDVNGIRFAFIAFTKGFSGMGLPAGAEYSVNLLYEDYATDYEKVDRDGIRSLVQTAQKANPDFIIASLHWGSENISGISSTQKEITSILLNAGVDVILGCHSHRLEKIEWRTVKAEDAPDRECVIAYGLGDFCSTTEGKSNTSVILDLEFTKNHDTGDHFISSVSYVPVSTVDNGLGASPRFAVVPTEDAIALYENNYYLRIGDDAYQAIVEDIVDLEETLFPPPSDDE